MLVFEEKKLYLADLFSEVGLAFGTNKWNAISNFICLQKDVKLSLSPLKLR